MLKRLVQVINQEYGSKRGLLCHHQARLAGLAGKWRAYRQIDWDRVDRLVFICMGNICRSPLAEVVAASAGYTACSLGVDCTSGMPADPRAVSYATGLGLDLSHHRTSLLSQAEQRPGDLIIGMEPRHLYAAQQVLGNVPAQLTLLGLWHPRPRPYIHDPYSTDEVFFQKCEQFVTEATQSLLTNVPHLQRAWKTSTPCA